MHALSLPARKACAMRETSASFVRYRQACLYSTTSMINDTARVRDVPGCRRSQPGIATCRRASRTLACGRIQSQKPRTRQRVAKKITKSRVIMDAVRLLGRRRHAALTRLARRRRSTEGASFDARPPLSARSTSRTFGHSDIRDAVGHGESPATSALQFDRSWAG